jgi:MFS transporter, YNFM family, putative membrane transport protein
LSSPVAIVSAPSPIRSIVLLAFAAFATQAMVRVTDPLLPQIAADFGTSVGAASIVVTAYGVSHGSVQLFIGPVGDRFGKYRTITIACGATCLMVLLGALAQSLEWLALARLAAGATAGWIVATSLAYIGDVTPYARRQQVIGRYVSGVIFGQMFGQAAGGVLGDLTGWRNVFFLLAGLFAVATAALIAEMIYNPRTRSAVPPEERSRGLLVDYVTVLSNPWARIVIFAVFIEGFFTWGTFTYLGADLHLRFGLNLTVVGLIVATIGVGGLIYALSVKQLVHRLGPYGIAIYGGLVLGAGFFIVALGLAWWAVPFGVTAIGLGFYMLHNTLQTNATQMSPQARGTAVGVFSSALYIGQGLGAGAGSLVVDRFGYAPLFMSSTIVLPLMAIWFARALRRHQSR